MRLLSPTISKYSLNKPKITRRQTFEGSFKFALDSEAKTIH
jgi:hypothetical protein